MKNLFLKNQEGKILKVSSICVCEECQERGMPELFIEDMNDNYVDCIKVSDLFSDGYILSDDFNALFKTD